MTQRFYFVWLIGAAIIACVTLIGLVVLHGMALNPTGYVSPTPWGMLWGYAVALALYWSAFCWFVGLVLRRSKWAGVVFAVAFLLAFCVPAADDLLYQRQQSHIAKQSILGERPEFADKTAVLLWPRKDGCTGDCWNLAQNMEARVLLLEPSNLETIDFGVPVDLLSQPLFELGEHGRDLVLQDGPQKPEKVDFVFIVKTQARYFDDAFDRLRPWGIPQKGLHVDGFILPLKDGRWADLVNDTPLLRQLHVSRTLSNWPWTLWAGRELYWNSKDRRANTTLAEPYFCTSEDREKSHWCGNAFD